MVWLCPSAAILSQTLQVLLRGEERGSHNNPKTLEVSQDG
jgi:hypothetical protein